MAKLHSLDHNSLCVVGKISLVVGFERVLKLGSSGNIRLMGNGWRGEGEQRLVSRGNKLLQLKRCFLKTEYIICISICNSKIRENISKGFRPMWLNNKRGELG